MKRATNGQTNQSRYLARDLPPGIGAMEGVLFTLEVRIPVFDAVGNFRCDPTVLL